MSYRSNSAAVISAYRQEAAGRVRRARNAHHDTTETAAPVRTGRMVSTLEKFEEGEHSAGLRMGGERAPYAQFVNDGHILRNGSFLPGQHFWEEGEAAGRAEMVKR